MSIAFRSLEHGDKHAYLYVTDSDTYWNEVYNAGSKNCVCERAGMYLTYGHGMAQHSGDYAVRTNYMQDYLGSLAHHMLNADRQERSEIVKTLRYRVEDITHWKPKISFLLSLRHDEKKERYFSVHPDSYLKVSTSDSKRHDKRWEVVPPEAGGYEWVWGVLLSKECVVGSLELYNVRSQFVDMVRECGGWVSESLRSYFGIEDDGQRYLNQAFSCLKAIVKSESEYEYAERAMECFLSNTKNDSVVSA